jgi:hypothetical protein
MLSAVDHVSNRISTLILLIFLRLVALLVRFLPISIDVNLLNQLVAIYTASFNPRTVFSPHSILYKYSNQCIISLYITQTFAFLMAAYPPLRGTNRKFVCKLD